MSKVSDKPKEFTAYEKAPLGYAIEALGKAVSSPWRDDVLVKTRQSIAYIQEFLGNAVSAPPINL